jgi:tetratricopeptide (TPR) repeat protein
MNRWITKKFIGQGPRLKSGCGILACGWLMAMLATTGAARPQGNELVAIHALMERGEFDEAEKRLHQYLLKLPHSSKANDLLGQVYLHRGNFRDAEKVLEKVVAAAPSFLQARIDLGDAYVAEGKMDLALHAYEQAANLAPHDVRANLALAKLNLGAGEFAKSLAAVGNIPVDQRTPELLPTLAADYFGLKQPEKAETEIQGMLEIAEKQPDLIPELAEFFLAHRDFKSAQQLFVLAKDRQPLTDRFQIDVARAQASLGQLDDAQKTIEGVLERSPKSVDALIAAGQVASQQSNWADAVEAFSRAAEMAPNRPDILYGLVSAALHADQPGLALSNAQKLHSLMPDDLRASYLMALALFGARKKHEAKPFAQEVLKEHPDDREMNLVMADIEFNEEQDMAAARKYVAISLKENANDPGALYYLGMIEKMEGDMNAAVQSLAKSVAGNPKNADAQGALGSLCLQTGDVPCSVRALEQAVALAPEEAQNHSQLALAYSRYGVPDKAKAQLEIYEQLKAKEAKQAKDLRGPSNSEVPPMGITSRP